MAISVPGGDYQVPVDIANAACDYLGASQIATFQDNTKVATRLSSRYDKVRKYELERNLWVFSIRKAVLRPLDSTSMTVTFAVWDATKTYVLGSTVTQGGRIWQATGAVAANLEPDANPGSWQEYFGPTTASPFSATTTYWAGELVYDPATTSAAVYLSLQNNNTQDPTVIAAWAAATTYNKGQTVTGSNATVYQSKVDLNVAIDPTTDAGVHWAAVPVANQADSPEGQGWLKLGGATLASVQIIYPLGFGPASDTATRNIYLLPNGFLREAPQDPKGGQLTWLGGPANNVMNDWNYENGYLTSFNVAPILLRFGADVTDVSRFDPMFCELFAARLALELTEVVTQAAEKKQLISAEYDRWGREARTRNGIEIGPVQADEDEYVTVRR